MPYRYTPPTWRNVVVFEKGSALRCGWPTCTVVYRQGGQWFNIMSPGVDSPVITSIDVDPSGLLLYFDRPTVVPDTLHDALAAVAPADASWTVGTLTPV